MKNRPLPPGEREQVSHRLGRGHMRFVHEEQSRMEPPAEVRLEFRDLRVIEHVVANRHPLEATQLALVPGTGDNQRAVLDQFRIDVAPKPCRMQPEVPYDRLGRFRLAIGRNHRARVLARGFGERHRHLLEDMHGMAGPRKKQRLPQSEYPGSRNRDLELTHPSSSVVSVSASTSKP